MIVELSDGQLRDFTLMYEGGLFCEFIIDGYIGPHKANMNGWCYWKRNDAGLWYTVYTNNGEGKAVAKPPFGAMLDEVHLQLIAEKELL